MTTTTEHHRREVQLDNLREATALTRVSLWLPDGRQRLMFRKTRNQYTDQWAPLPVCIDSDALNGLLNIYDDMREVSK